MLAFSVAIIVGVIILTYGAEKFVKSASHIASFYKVSPLVIGLTIVAIGTSMPEIAVSLLSAIEGNPDLAVGNVVGSNIFNILIVLGLSALFSPLVVQMQLIKIEVPIMIVSALVFYFFARDFRIELFEAGIFTLGFIAFSYYQIRQSKGEKNLVQDEYKEEIDKIDEKAFSLIKEICWVALSITLLVLGSKLFVYGAENIALALGVPQIIIGLTVVAAGTSLPELATSVVAAYRGHNDLAIGNVVGSNICNVLLVLGLSGVFSFKDIAVSQIVLQQDLPFMIFVSIFLLPLLYTGMRLVKWEASLLVVLYGIYVSLLCFQALNHHYASFTRDLLVIFASLAFLTSFCHWLWTLRRKRSEALKSGG